MADLNNEPKKSRDGWFEYISSERTMILIMAAVICYLISRVAVEHKVVESVFKDIFTASLAALFTIYIFDKKSQDRNLRELRSLLDEPIQGIKDKITEISIRQSTLIESAYFSQKNFDLPAETVAEFESMIFVSPFYRSKYVIKWYFSFSNGSILLTVENYYNVKNISGHKHVFKPKLIFDNRNPLSQTPDLKSYSIAQTAGELIKLDINKFALEGGVEHKSSLEYVYPDSFDINAGEEWSVRNSYTLPKPAIGSDLIITGVPTGLIEFECTMLDGIKNEHFAAHELGNFKLTPTPSKKSVQFSSDRPVLPFQGFELEWRLAHPKRSGERG